MSAPELPTIVEVTWGIDTLGDDFDSAREAAEWAHACIVRPGSIAHVYNVVYSDGSHVAIDIDYPDDPEVGA